LPILLAALAAPAAVEAAAPIRVALRYDDPSAKSNTEIETRLIETLRQYEMVCTFSVIPFIYAELPDRAPSAREWPLPAQKAEPLAAAAREGLLELAQHGYSHRANTPPGTKPSEFAGLDYDEQWRKIQAGRTFLENTLGMAIRTFVPPFNTYDANTIRAAEAGGLTCLSADMWRPADPTSTMAFLPATCTPVDVKQAVADARDSGDPAPVIVVLFHEYEFLEIDAARGIMTFEQFLANLQWLSEQPDVRVVPMREISDAGSRRYAANRRLLSTPRLLPYKLRGRLYPRVLLSQEGVNNTLRRNRPALRLAGFYGLQGLSVALVSFFIVGNILARIPAVGSKLLWISGPALLTASLVWAFRGGHFGGRTRMLMAIVAAAGYCLGTWAMALWRRRRVHRATRRQ
jgi:hypothetical protein